VNITGDNLGFALRGDMRWIICFLLAFAVTVIDMLTRETTDDFTKGFGPLELIGTLILWVIFLAIWWIAEKIIAMFRKQSR
jgi:hypothetical protein